MTERERLIHLIGEIKSYEYGGMATVTDEGLADYLLVNGIIVPPVKVGDKVYIKYQKKIYPVTVYAIRVDTKTNSKRICVDDWLQIDEYHQHSYTATFKWESIGKTIFLTREEAENALKEQKK